MRAAWAGLLLVIGLSGCASDQERYCDAVAEHQKELSVLSAEGGQGAIFEILDIYRDLAAKAPSDITDEWSQVIGRIENLEQVLESAGVDPESYDPENPPTDLSTEDRSRIKGAADDLADRATIQAMDGLAQQSLDVCKNPMTL